MRRPLLLLMLAAAARGDVSIALKPETPLHGCLAAVRRALAADYPFEGETDNGCSIDDEGALSCHGVCRHSRGEGCARWSSLLQVMLYSEPAATTTPWEEVPDRAWLWRWRHAAGIHARIEGDWDQDDAAPARLALRLRRSSDTAQRVLDQCLTKSPTVR